MKRLSLALVVALMPLSCRRATPSMHAVSIVESGSVLMVSATFGMPGAASATSASAIYAGARPGRCVRLPSARQLVTTPEVARAVRNPTAVRYRDAGELTLRDDRGPTLAVLRPAMYGMYFGMIPRGDARRLRVSVAGGDGVPAHAFDSVPLNPPGNPTRLTAPAQGFEARRGGALRFAWAGAGYRDAFLQVMVGAPGGSDARAVLCRLDYGRGAITLAGRDLDLAGSAGALALSATLTTMTSSVEGPWLLSVMSSSGAVSGVLR